MSNAADTDFDQLTRSLTENFSILADEVQLLSDRKTVLEHKLRFAHEQYQTLADKYAPSTDPDIQSTLAALQLPPELKRTQSITGVPVVPLPPRLSGNSKQATAEAIRDGRRASLLLATLKGWTRSSEDSNRSASIASRSSRNIQSRRAGASSSFTTFNEQDFTVPGRKSQLLCPFVQKSNHLRRISAASSSKAGESMMPDREANAMAPDMEDNTPHHSADPICAALYAETHVSAPPSATGSNKCPIRFMDQHSPEEIAAYFETHKHEIPRSHEICVKRYQRSETDVRKLDAKYGSNIVNMLQGLGQKHQPMLPKDEEEEEYLDLAQEKKQNERVEKWANNVSQDGIDPADPADPAEPATSPLGEDEDERGSRFDRPMKEVRVGESPSRPWGISVPWNQPDIDHYGDDEAPNSPPVPVVVPAFHGKDTGPRPPRPAGVCPFGHGASKPKLSIPEAQVEIEQEPPHPRVKDPPNITRPAGKCPFGHGSANPPNRDGPVEEPLPTPQYSLQYQPRYDAPQKSETFATTHIPARSVGETFATSHVEPTPRMETQNQAPTFLAPPQQQGQHQHQQQPQMDGNSKPGPVVPQMVFNGPVFIGYPVEQAMMLMQQWQAGMQGPR